MNELSNNQMIEALPLDGDRDLSSVSSSVNSYLSEIQSKYKGGILTKIPYSEIAALGGSLSAVGQIFRASTAEPLYRCVFPKGVEGVLAQAKDGSGALGTILKKDGGLAQARWIESGAVPVDPTILLVAVAVLGIAKQVSDIKQGQQEIIGILERDKKNQLLADFEILSNYMSDYKYYWENTATVTVNLNQVKNIKRNADKDVRSYQEQVEQLISTKCQLLEKLSTSKKIGKILDRFVHYKLALHVLALASYMEVMLSKNFQAEYLDKISKELRDFAFRYRTLYTECYDKIESLKKEGIENQVSGGLAKLSKSVGKTIAGIPVIKNGPVDELLISAGESLDAVEKKRLQETLEFFIRHKNSDLIPVVEHIDQVNQMANQPTEMIWSDNVIYLISDKRKSA